MPIGKSRARSDGTPGLSKAWILCAALLLGYLFLLCDKAILVAGGSDSSGYLNAARLLARGKLTEAVEPLRRFGLSQEFVHVFIPLGFSPGARPGTMVPSYPPGLPLHMAAAALVGGWARAPFWVSPLAATLCLLLVYGIGRELGMTQALAVAAAACLAAFPSFFWFGLQPMSDVLRRRTGLPASRSRGEPSRPAAAEPENPGARALGDRPRDRRLLDSPIPDPRVRLRRTDLSRSVPLGRPPWFRRTRSLPRCR